MKQYRKEDAPDWLAKNWDVILPIVRWVVMFIIELLKNKNEGDKKGR